MNKHIVDFRVLLEELVLVQQSHILLSSLMALTFSKSKDNHQLLARGCLDRRSTYSQFSPTEEKEMMMF